MPTESGFSLTARRLDVNGGWGQNPSVSFFAWSNGFPYKNFGGINYATGTATTNSPTLSVAFSSAVDQQGSFTAAPIVVVTPRAKVRGERRRGTERNRTWSLPR